jgi:hypothetical protein
MPDQNDGIATAVSLTEPPPVRLKKDLLGVVKVIIRKELS